MSYTDDVYDSFMKDKILTTEKELDEVVEGTIIAPGKDSNYHGAALKVTTLDWTMTGYTKLNSLDFLLKISKSWTIVGRIPLQ